MFTCAIDLREFDTLVGRTLDAIDDGIRAATLNAARQGAAEARKSAFKDRTGQLRRGLIGRLVEASHLRAEAEFVSLEKYSKFVDLGTAPHEIWPKAGYNAPKGSLRPGQTRRARGKGPHEHIVGRGRALRWKDAGGGEHFAGMVHHPGTPAFNFSGQAYLKAERVLYRDIELLMRAVQHIWERAA